MAAPLYFLPTKHTADLVANGRLKAETIAACGLDQVLADVRDVAAECLLTDLRAAGPGGQSGTLLCALADFGKRPQTRLGYYPKFQTWSQVYDRGADQLWIGLDNEDPVTPEDMQRRQRHDGYLVELADGRKWCVPIIRRPDGSTALPRDLGWDAAGNWQESIKAAYRGVWDDAAEVIGWFQQGLGQVATAEMPRILTFCLRALGLNYRLGPAEQSVLHLIDSTNWATVLMCAIDGPTVIEIQEAEKKRLAHGARAHEYLSWAAGRLPDHRPSRGELLLAASGYGTPRHEVTNYYVVRR